MRYEIDVICESVFDLARSFDRLEASPVFASRECLRSCDVLGVRGRFLSFVLLLRLPSSAATSVCRARFVVVVVVVLRLR